MGLILDSSAVIAGERQGLSAADLLVGIRNTFGPEPVVLTTVSVIELEHGIWRARDAAAVATANVRHFAMIPNLVVKQL